MYLANTPDTDMTGEFMMHGTRSVSVDGSFRRLSWEVSKALHGLAWNVRLVAVPRSC